MTTELMIRSVLVAGSGAMGWGILRSFAGSGFAATLLSRNPESLPPLPAGAHAVPQRAIVPHIWHGMQPSR